MQTSERPGKAKREIQRMLGEGIGWREIIGAIGECAQWERMAGGYDDAANEMLFAIQDCMAILYTGEEDHCTRMVIPWTVNQLDER